MTAFLQVALSFPTALWSVALVLCAAACLLALLGSLDGLPDDGLLARVGLGGVPLLPVLTALTLVGWLTCYLGHLLLSGLPLGMWRGAALTGVLVGSLLVGLLAAQAVARPLRRLVQGQEPTARADLLGRTATVESGTLDTSGRVSVPDGGAGLVLEARTDGEPLRRGEQVILVAHDPATHIFTVERVR